MSDFIRTSATAPASRWLRGYYFARFAVAAVWVAAAFTIAPGSAVLAAVMLIAYPAWDGVANLIDARRNGGLAVNKAQRFNSIVSVLAAIAVVIALTKGMNAVLVVYGGWAAVAGVCQLTLAMSRRRAYGAQWAMVLSGAQSALAGIFFVKMARDVGNVSIANVAPYAAFGAFYFLVSAIWMTATAERGPGRRSHVAACGPPRARQPAGRCREGQRAAA